MIITVLLDYELVILNELDEISSGLIQELSSYLDNGGNYFGYSISMKGDMAGFRRISYLSVGSNYYTGFITEETRVSSLDLNNPVFADVFEKSA